MDDLTPLQKRFAEEYVKDLNATQAAKRAGSTANDLSAAGAELLRNPKVSDLVDKLKTERSRQTGIDAAWLLKRLADEATADINDLYDEDGKLLPVNEWPLIWRQGLIAGIKTRVSEDGVAIVDVKVSDRIRRLELIGKHISVQAFQEVIQHKGLEGLADRLSRAETRLDDE